MRFDRGMMLSVAGHGLVLVWALVSFARPLEINQSEMFPVDVLTAEEFTKITAGDKKAEKKEAPKPVVEKVAEAKPVEDLTAKINDKKEVTATTDETRPEPAPKKPDPKPAAAPPEPKQEAKAADKKEPEQKIDPIADALKKDDAKKPEKKVESKPQPVKKPEPQQPKFDPRKVAALLDKREPQRMASAGATINNTASLGVPKGSDASLTASEQDAIRRRITNNWTKPPGAENLDLLLDIEFSLRLDGTFSARPVVKTRGTGPIYDAVRDSAMRAIMKSEPFNFLSPSRYEHWKELIIAFNTKDPV